jgi:hypothetical protein
MARHLFRQDQARVDTACLYQIRMRSGFHDTTRFDYDDLIRLLDRPESMGHLQNRSLSTPDSELTQKRHLGLGVQ